MSHKKSVLHIQEPKKNYDVIIIGGGLHGLACAHYLAKDHGITDVAILERNRLGYGGSGRNTEVFRSNQRELLPLYLEAIELWRGLSVELDFNVMFWDKGIVGLAHNEGTFEAMRGSHETQRQHGIESEYPLTPQELKKLVPRLDITDKPDNPIVGGYFNPNAGTIRHDAAVWGFAQSCHRKGIHLCEGVEVKEINVKDNKVTGVVTNKGSISAPLILNAAGGWSSIVAKMAGLDLPLVTRPLQAMVTEPVAPFLDHCVVSETYFCYGSQTIKGDFVIGAHLDAWQSYKLYNTFDFASDLAYGWTQLFPDLAHVKVMRTWSGLCDLAPDATPIMGESGVDGFYLDVGWGFFGFKSVPVCGKAMAEFMIKGKRPKVLEEVGLERFYEGRLVPSSTAARE